LRSKKRTLCDKNDEKKKKERKDHIEGDPRDNAQKGDLDARTPKRKIRQRTQGGEVSARGNRPSFGKKYNYRGEAKKKGKRCSSLEKRKKGGWKLVFRKGD